MHRFKEMDPEKIRAILDAVDEGGQPLHRDILTPLSEKEDRHFKTATCPTCKAGSCTPTLDLLKPFSTDYPLPNRILRCPACGTEFDPYTKFVRLVPLTYGRD